MHSADDAECGTQNIHQESEDEEDTTDNNKIDGDKEVAKTNNKRPLFLHHTMWNSKDKEKVKPIDFEEYERIQSLTRHPQKRFDHVYTKAKLKTIPNKPNIYKDNMMYKYCRFCDEYLPISQFHPSQIRRVCRAHFRQIINFDLYKRYLRDPYEYHARFISLLYCSTLKLLYDFKDEKVFGVILMNV